MRQKANEILSPESRCAPHAPKIEKYIGVYVLYQRVKNPRVSFSLIVESLKKVNVYLIRPLSKKSETSPTNLTSVY